MGEGQQFIIVGQLRWQEHETASYITSIVKIWEQQIHAWAIVLSLLLPPLHNPGPSTQRMMHREHVLPPQLPYSRQPPTDISTGQFALDVLNWESLPRWIQTVLGWQFKLNITGRDGTNLKEEKFRRRVYEKCKWSLYLWGEGWNRRRITSSSPVWDTM